jgi:hypothetical protein
MYIHILTLMQAAEKATFLSVGGRQLLMQASPFAAVAMANIFNLMSMRGGELKEVGYCVKSGARIVGHFWKYVQCTCVCKHPLNYIIEKSLGNFYSEKNPCTHACKNHVHMLVNTRLIA